MNEKEAQRQKALPSVAKGISFLCLTAALLVLLNLSNYSFAEESGKIKKHVVFYGSFGENDIQTIASNFDIVDTSFSKARADAVKQIKSLNPGVIAIGYKHSLGIYPHDPDWDMINRHEDWFMHDESGHRLRHAVEWGKDWDWYLMDPGSAGWRQYMTNWIVNKLKEYPEFDGIFFDTCLSFLPTNRWGIDISGEQSTVINSGKTVTAKHPIWDVKGVYDNSERTGTNYFTGGDFSDQTITLGSSSPARPTAYIDYRAKDENQFKPPQAKVDSWATDMKGLLQAIKSAMGSKILIINSGNSADFLDVADGKMYEHFLHSTRSGDDSYPTVDEWNSTLENQREAVAEGKFFLARCGTSGDSKGKGTIEKLMMFAFASYLLTFDPTYSSFSFSVRDSAPTAYFPKTPLSIGKPKGDYYLVAREGAIGNLLDNGSFETNFHAWSVERHNSDAATPNISTSVSYDGAKSAHFSGPSGNSINGQYISVKPETTYELSGAFRGSNIVSGEKWYHKLAVRGDWYDSDRNHLGQFNVYCESLGTFDWIYNEGRQTSPPRTAYFRLGRTGLEGNCSGEGWIDDIRFGEYRAGSSPSVIYGREFVNGLVLVNVGERAHTLTLGEKDLVRDGETVSQITLGGHESAILTSAPLAPPTGFCLNAN